MIIKRFILIILSASISSISLYSDRVIYIIIYALMILAYRVRKSESDEDYTAKYGTKVKAFLYSCPSRLKMRSYITVYYPHFSFVYNGETLFREATGDFRKMPCQLEETIDAVYCDKTDILMIIDENYEKHKNEGDNTYRPIIGKAELICVFSTIIMTVVFYYLITN